MEPKKITRATRYVAFGAAVTYVLSLGLMVAKYAITGEWNPAYPAIAAMSTVSVAGAIAMYGVSKYSVKALESLSELNKSP